MTLTLWKTGIWGEDAGHSKYSMKDPTASLIPDSKKKHYTASALDFDEEADDGYRNAGILSYGAYLMWKGTSGGGYTAEETGITDISVLSRLRYRSRSICTAMPILARWPML